MSCARSGRRLEGREERGQKFDEPLHVATFDVQEASSCFLPAESRRIIKILVETDHDPEVEISMTNAPSQLHGIEGRAIRRREHDPQELADFEFLLQRLLSFPELPDRDIKLGLQGRDQTRAEPSIRIDNENVLSRFECLHGSPPLIEDWSAW